MKKIIVTAGDENFSVLLNKLIDSLVQFDEPLSDAIGLLDLGLSPRTLEKLKNKVDHIIQPGWNLAVDENVAKQKPHLRGVTSRPFLPEYFPGYDLYLWLDADTWVQNRFAVDWLFAAASSGRIGIVPEVHQSCVHRTSTINWKVDRLRAYYMQNGVNLFRHNTYYNAGVFALKKDAPHWRPWAKQFQIGLDNCGSKYVSDQTALNYTIWTEKLSVHSLPAICNWCYHMALPLVNSCTGKFCESHIPHREIGIIHMTGNTKDTSFRYKALDVESIGNLDSGGFPKILDKFCGVVLRLLKKESG